jgi:nucleotidyltransferase/DNA polymerase involved in DNA repair
MSRFCCIWIPDFAAWAAIRNNLALLHQPVVVYAGGRVIAASPQARADGVQTSWPIERVKALVPECVAVAHHNPVTLLAWDSVLSQLYGLTPCVEGLRPGLALANVHRPTVVKPLLQDWGAHGGVADDRTTAELAALTTAPGTLRTIKEYCSAAFLRRVPITTLRQVGVGSDTMERLEWFGWHTVAHLRPLTKKQLLSQFNEGELLYRYAQATDTGPVATYRLPPAVHVHFTFEEAVREPSQWEPVLDLLAQQACERLDGRLVQSMTTSVLTSDGTLHQQRLLRDPTSSVFSLRQSAGECVRYLLHSGIAVRGLQLRLGHLTTPRAVQGQLFRPSRPPVSTVMQTVEHRFPGALRKFRVTDGGAYLPEEFARLEPLALPEPLAPMLATSRKVQAGRSRRSRRPASVVVQR